MSVFRPGLFKEKVAIVTGIVHFTLKTRTKVVHKNINQGCNEVRRSKSKNVKVTI